MSDENDVRWLSPDDVFADFGEKVRRGYDPEVVDRHLEAVAAGVKALRREVDGSRRIDDESLQVMMRAGRRSVEEALEVAREKADGMVTEAEAEAQRLLDEAHARANQIRTAGEEEAKLQEETVEIRRIEIAALDEEIEARQAALRAAAADLVRLADGIVDDVEVDLRDPRPSDASPSGGSIAASDSAS